MKPAPTAAFALALTLLAACKDETAALPDPAVMTDEALGHYCQMYLADHAGPKAQAFLDGYFEPIWFAQVADAAAYMTDPEKPAQVVVVYVSDMDKAESWAVPGEANWVAADKASFVIESNRPGGMGLPEAIPFGTEAGAKAFVAEHGGRIVTWDTIPQDYVHTDADQVMPMAMEGDHTHMEVGQ